MKNINEFKYGWYGTLEDLIEELTAEGYDVLEANSEYVTCAGNEDDVQYVLHLDGTRTIKINRVETIRIN